jgi:hypothetical protein
MVLANYRTYPITPSAPRNGSMSISYINECTLLNTINKWSLNASFKIERNTLTSAKENSFS